MNSKDIQVALFFCLKNKNHEMIAPNIHCLMGEQDMLSFTKAGYACEFEVKISRSDYKNDFKKVGERYRTKKRKRGKWIYEKHENLKHDILSGEKEAKEKWKKPKYFWFVVPEGLIGENEVPEYAGLMYAIENTKTKHISIKVVKRAPALKGVSPAPKKVFNSILTSLKYRFYDLWIKK